VETDATRMCVLLVGLADVIVLAVDDQRGQPPRVHVEHHVDRPRLRRVRGGGVGVRPPGRGAGGSGVLGRPAQLGAAQTPLVLPGIDVSGGLVERSESGDRRLPVGDDLAGQWATAQAADTARRSLVSSAVTVTASTTPSSPTAPRWSTIRTGSDRSPRSGPMRCSSPGRAPGAPRRGRSRWPMSPADNCSMCS
jgi:hypothetical protein